MVKKLGEGFDYINYDYKSNIRVQDKLDYMPKVYTINFWHEFDSDASIYAPYFDVIEKAREHDEIVFYFNSGGGDVHTLNLFLNALRRCKSEHVLARVNYAASAAALMALFCDNIEFNTNSTLMLHTYSSVEVGKGQEIESSVMHTKQEYEGLIKLICSKILSKEEIEQLLNGKDFYFNGREAIERLKKRAKEIEKEMKHKGKK